MKVRAVFGNPYKEGLLRVAFDQGERARRQGVRPGQEVGMRSRTWFAWCAGYDGRGWDRGPNGQVKWHRGGA